MPLEEDIRRLGRIQLFERLEPEALKLLAFSAEIKILRRGELLFRRGDKADVGFFVVSGAMALYTTPDGSSEADTVGPGALIGEMALLTQTIRQATCVARDPSELLVIPRSVFKRILEEYPEAAVSMRDALAERLSRLMQDLQISLAMSSALTENQHTQAHDPKGAPNRARPSKY